MALQKDCPSDPPFPKPLGIFAARKPRKAGNMTTRQITITVPEKILLAEKTTEADFAREMRLLAAIKMYELGRLSSGRAAELAGMSRVEFLLTLEKYHVFPLESELRDLEGTHD